MTEPVQPTPGAPVEPPAQPAVPAPTTPIEDLASLPDWAQKQIRDARAEAGKARTNAKQQAAEEARQELTQQLAKALGLAEQDKPVDPAVLTEQIQQAQSAAWRSGTELQVHRVASRLGANAEALLDSMSFVDTLDDLVEVDPRSPEFAAALEAKVQQAMDRNASFKVPTRTMAPDPSQGRGGSSAPPDFRTADKAAFEAELASYGLRPRSYS